MYVERNSIKLISHDSPFFLMHCYTSRYLHSKLGHLFGIFLFQEFLSPEKQNVSEFNTWKYFRIKTGVASRFQLENSCRGY